MHDTAAPRVGRAPAAEGKLAASDPIGNHVGGPAGTFALNVDTLLVPVAPSVAVAVGERSTFQGWSRDANPATTSNFTDAVEVLFECRDWVRTIAIGGGGPMARPDCGRSPHGDIRAEKESPRGLDERS